jgi:hypothetical protein
MMADGEIAETDATKVVMSTLRTINKTVPQRLKIEKIRYDIRGFSNVSLRYDDDEETPIANLGAGQGVLCFSTGIISQLSTDDSTGDVLLTSVSDGSGELGYYTVIIDFEVKD